jgi:hypothetical protein
MNPGDFATLPHPFKDSDNKAQTGRGKEPPSWVRVVLPFLPLGLANHLAVGPPRGRMGLMGRIGRITW